MYEPSKPPAWLLYRQRNKRYQNHQNITDLSQTALCSNVWSIRTGQPKPMSQQALANKIGVSRKTINTIETGKSQPSLLIALRLAKVLDTPVDKLFRLE